MGEILKNIIHGIGQAMEASPQTGYVRPGRDGFRRDFYNINKDASNVAKDMRKAVDKYGKQIHDRQRQAQ